MHDSWKGAQGTAFAAANEFRWYVTDSRIYSRFRWAAAKHFSTGKKYEFPAQDTQQVTPELYELNRRLLWKCLYREGKAHVELGLQELRLPLTQESLEKAGKSRQETWKCEFLRLACSGQ